MPPRPPSTRRSPSRTRRSLGEARPIEELLDETLAYLKRTGRPEVRDGMARYAIPSDNAHGIPVGELRKYAKLVGPNHELAAALWEDGTYEARMLAAFVDVPAQVTPAQMDRWCREFDNWAICDTVCFHLFDRTPHAWRKVEQWSRSRSEFVKRASFALLSSLSVHDKRADDALFLNGLQLVEGAAGDERNFVKKSVNWALRSIGKRNATLHAAAVETSRRLAASDDATARWVGKDALRELCSAAVLERITTPRRRG